MLGLKLFNKNLNSKKIEQEQEVLNAQIRKRRNRAGAKKTNYNKNNNNNYDDDSDNQTDEPNRALAKRKNLFVSKRKANPLSNRLLFGFTFTVGVAAVAMYAMNSSVREPQEIISKVYQLFNYRDFF